MAGFVPTMRVRRNEFIVIAYFNHLSDAPLTPDESRASVAPLTEGNLMAQNSPGRRSILSRWIAAAILTGIYCFSFVGTTALVLGASTTEASARGRGRGRGRGASRGRGRGRGVTVIRRGRGAGCHFSPRHGRVICY
jgi:hypothetical protein